MKRFKGFGARPLSFELLTPTSDVQTPKLKKISQVADISRSVDDDHRGSTTATELPETQRGVEFNVVESSSQQPGSGRVWKNPLRGIVTPSHGSSFSSSSDVHCGIHCSSSRLSDTSSATSSGEPGIVRQGRAIVVAFDANVRDAVVGAATWAFRHVLQSGDVLALVGVMDYLRGPLGYKCQVNDQTWLGANTKHLHDEIALQSLVWSATPGLQTSCEERGVKLVVTVKPAARPEVVIVQDAVAFGAAHVVLDRSLKNNPRGRKFYLERLNCDVTRMRRSGGVELLRSSTTKVYSPAAPALKPSSYDDELFTIDHCVVATPTRPDRRGDMVPVDEKAYESDDLFSLCDDGAWRTSSFVGLLSQRPDPTVAAHDRDPATACIVPPRTSVDSGPRLDKRLLSKRLQLRD